MRGYRATYAADNGGTDGNRRLPLKQLKDTIGRSRAFGGELGKSAGSRLR
jgi:hypothetical protein